MQKPFQLNIPRHNKTVCKRMDLGFNKNFQILEIYPSCAYHQYTRYPEHPWTQAIYHRDYEEIREWARMSLCSSLRQVILQRNHCPLYPSQVSLKGGKSLADKQCPTPKLDLEKPQCLALTQNQFSLICIFWTSCQAIGTQNTMSQRWNYMSVFPLVPKPGWSLSPALVLLEAK